MDKNANKLKKYRVIVDFGFGLGLEKFNVIAVNEEHIMNMIKNYYRTSFVEIISITIHERKIANFIDKLLNRCPKHQHFEHIFKHI